MNERAGFLRTNLSGEAQYKSFVPAPLPPNPAINLDGETLDLLIRTNRQMAALESIVSRIADINLFISMYVRKEALMSSQIEGTQATLEDILDPLSGKNANQNAAEVINYVQSATYALERLKTLPISNRLLKETHKILMKDVRGKEKTPGEFRRSQNWIGAVGSTLKTARYVPPNTEDMTVAMGELEKYINSDDNLDVLIRAALIHYQLETIHPFLDGNGRIGRLLIILFLIEKKALSTPALYISYFLKKNRIEYYDRLTEVRNNGNYEQWIKFFLQAFFETATDAVKTIDELTALRAKNIALIQKSGNAKNAAKLFRYLETSPIINIQKTAKALDLSYNTAAAIVKKFEKLGILAKTSGKLRNKIFSYKKYLAILRNGTE